MALIKNFRIKSFKQKKPILKLENVSLSFGNRQILENINFEINKGEIFGMLGPNGVGKSTIFNLVTGLISPEKGSIFIGGEKVNNFPIFLRTTKFKIGYVPQYGGYFNDLSLEDNLSAIAEIVIENKILIKDKVNFLINKFELDNTSDIKFSVDSSIMGGIKVRIGNKIIDGSVSTKLRKIKQSLLGI